MINTLTANHSERHSLKILKTAPMNDKGEEKRNLSKVTGMSNNNQNNSTKESMGINSNSSSQD
jgi:hypothetical protein